MKNGSDRWKKWLDEYGAQLLLFARQFTPSHADAENIVQEAFVRFWRSGRFRNEDPRCCLYSYLRQAAIDFIRSEKRRKIREEVASQQLYQIETLFENTLEQEEWQEAVENAMKELPVEQREVLVIKIWGELTFAQIAKVLNISPNTAASRYRYALNALRNHNHLKQTAGVNI